MPKYSIQDEAFENQSVARIRAFGKDRDVAMQQENIDQSSADAVRTAQDVSSSTSDLLGTVAAIESSNTAAKRGLTQDEAGIRRQNIGDLYAVNTAMIDEKDKAWRQNVHAPWDAKLRNLQQRKANRSAFWSSLAGGVLGAAGMVLGGPLGGRMAGGGGQQQTQDQQTDASLNGYNPYMPYS